MRNLPKLASEIERKAQLLYQQALQAGSGPGGGTGTGGGPAHSRERNIYDVRDYKLADLEKGASAAFLNKWKHDLELYIETIGAS